MVIRNYRESDLAAFEKIDPFFATVLLKYHTGIKKENIISAMDDNHEVIGLGYLILHETTDPKKKQVVEFFASLKESNQGDMEIVGQIMDGLIARFCEIKGTYSDRQWCMRVCYKADEIKDMQFLLEKGFSLGSVVPVFKCDLLQEIEHYVIPSDVYISEFSFTESSMKEYMNVADMADGAVESEADTWFKTGDPSFKCFVAKCNSGIVGAISVWNISGERAATENIFVNPSFRNRNIARELIATAFEELKKRGIEIATLSLSGNNLPAMKLYLSCGYSLYYNLIEVIYE